MHWTTFEIALGAALWAYWWGLPTDLPRWKSSSSCCCLILCSQGLMWLVQLLRLIGVSCSIANKPKPLCWSTHEFAQASVWSSGHSRSLKSIEIETPLIAIITKPAVWTELELNWTRTWLNWTELKHAFFLWLVMTWTGPWTDEDSLWNISRAKNSRRHCIRK